MEYWLDLNEETDPLTQHFSYANNVTICDDGTVCPNLKNETCCNKHQGRTEINYHNRARLPESVTGLASYYSQAGYTIPGSSASGSVKVHAAQATSVPKSAAQSSVSVSSTSSTSVQATMTSSYSPSSTKQTLSPTPSSSDLSTGAKAGIGVGVGVVALICATVAFVFYIRRPGRNSNAQGGPSQGHWYPWHFKDANHGATSAYFSPELGSEATKYEVDGSTETQTSITHELASDGGQRKS